MNSWQFISDKGKNNQLSEYYIKFMFFFSQGNMTDLKHQLCLSVAQGELRKVEDLLDQFVLASSVASKALRKNPKRPKLEYLTYKSQFDLLTTAIENNHPVIVKLLIQRGFRISNDKLPSSPSSLLHIAVQAGNLEIVKLLLEFGHQVDARDKRDGTTIILHAVDTQNVEIVKVLLEHDASTIDGSPLDQAIKLQNLEMIQVLGDFGVDFSGATEEAIKTKNINVFEFVVQKSDLSIATPAGEITLLKTYKCDFLSR